MSVKSNLAAATAVEDMVALLDATALLAAFSMLQTKVQDAEYPRLTVASPHNTGDPQITCPHCGIVLTNEDWIDLVVVDLAWRSTQADSIDFEARTVSIWYDSDGDYEGLIYQCGNCSEPVRLPEDWSEVAR